MKKTLAVMVTLFVVVSIKEDIAKADFKCTDDGAKGAQKFCADVEPMWKMDCCQTEAYQACPVNDWPKMNHFRAICMETLSPQGT